MTPPPAAFQPLRVEERGRGAPLVLLHGFTGSVEAWPETSRTGLAEICRVLTLDLPGHGASPGGAEPAQYRMSRVVTAVLDALDRRGIPRAIFVGYSMGGRVALAIAAMRPERVERLVLESSSPGLETAEERERRRKRDHELALEIERRGVHWFVDHWMSRPLFASQQRLGPARIQAERRRRLQNRAGALAACLRGLGTGSQPSFWSDLPGVGAETLLLTGEADAKFTRIAQRMARQLPHGRHRVVPGAGHAVHLEAPEAWLATVTAFCRV